MKKNVKKINNRSLPPSRLDSFVSHLIPQNGNYKEITHIYIDFFDTVVKIQRSRMQPYQLF